MKRIGLDIGSTTVKGVVLDELDNIITKFYERHKSNIKEKVKEFLFQVKALNISDEFIITSAGSSAMGLCDTLSISFVQEVFALEKAIEHYHNNINVAIELGGEDAKILFMPPIEELRMNGSCAGGTGAFIDQMASLLGTDSQGLNTLAKNGEVIYSIASRCGVFAKSDIQPLLNQGARKSDIALSVLYSIVNQTVSGLSQGRKIEGNVLYLGGPLHFLDSLRTAFDDVLKIKGISDENSLYYVALGSIFAARETKPTNLDKLLSKLENATIKDDKKPLEALFKNDKEYEEFKTRHENDNKNIRFVNNHNIEEGYLGIDSGSTTIKAVLLDKDKNIIDSLYTFSNGRAVDICLEYIKSLYKKYPKLKIVSSTSTGYGEDLIKNAFLLDRGVVETIAHFRAAKYFRDNVDFIIDIGGQDIKCFRIRNNAIDTIFLSEACSSGCGSFLATFASLSGFSIEEFSSLALKSKNPCDLGSRCTVFMNSSVKQAQKSGYKIEDIAAGLSLSVVKNALYKVIRTSKKDIGNNIVVQGGTFASDAVLRCFEKEVGKNCIRPNISPLMGAFGCALISIEKRNEKTQFITREDILNFSYTQSAITCKGCTNACSLLINIFDGNKRFISGNKCQRPLGEERREEYNIYHYKRELLKKYENQTLSSEKINIGLPLGLNMYELLPFWQTLFSFLNFNTVVSVAGNRKMYLKSQYSVPSDTVCYPAKLMHGCIEDLKDRGVDIIFYPNMTYNIDERVSENHYNCPVVAYYPEVIDMNYDFEGIKFFSPFVDIANRKRFPRYFYKAFVQNKIKVSYKLLKNACEKAFKEYDDYKDKIVKKADELLKTAKEKNMPAIILASRPYHIDEEINHSIDFLITSLGAVVLSEDGIRRNEQSKLGVLNQWTYHARLFNAAKFVSEKRDENIHLVQLVSFGCGIDAITQDEVRSIVEQSGKVYTSIKIDEIANQGAVKIRLRSLFSIIENKFTKN